MIEYCIIVLLSAHRLPLLVTKQRDHPIVIVGLEILKFVERNWKRLRVKSLLSVQTMNRVDDTCPLTIPEDGLQTLHDVDDDVLN